MAPRMVQIKCPNCHSCAGNIPVAMGDKTIKCRICGKYIHYGWRKQEIEITDRPERKEASGLTFC